MSRTAGITTQLPTFTRAGDTSSKVGKAPAGEYPILEESVHGGDRWWKIHLATGEEQWIVAESPAGKWWAQEKSGPGPDSPATSSSKSPPGGTGSRATGSTTISDATALELERAIPADASAGQRRAVRWALSKMGVFVEDQGENRGHVLTPKLIKPYTDFQKIEDDGLAWCGMFAEAARYHGVVDPHGDGELDLLDKSAWKKHPLQTWIGMVCVIEQKAMEQGLWVPAAELQSRAPGARITAAALVMERAASGSDHSGGATGAAPGATYSGHVDVAIAWTDDGKLLGVGGNLSNIVKKVVRSTSDIRGAVLFPG